MKEGGDMTKKILILIKQVQKSVGGIKFEGWIVGEKAIKDSRWKKSQIFFIISYYFQFKNSAGPHNHFKEEIGGEKIQESKDSSV